MGRECAPGGRAHTAARQKVVVQLPRTAERSDGRARAHQVLRDRIQRREPQVLLGVSDHQASAHVRTARSHSQNLQVICHFEFL